MIVVPVRDCEETDRRKRDGPSSDLIAAALFVLGVATRLPFRGQILYSWDAVNYALGTVRFDLSQDQPHPPGAILYEALGWLGDLATHDPQTTFVMLSVLFSGLAASALFYLGSATFDRRTGVVAGILLLASPLFWFYGELALPHDVDCFFVVLIVLLLYRAWQGQDQYLLAAAPVLAAAGGIRPQTVEFLVPLCLLVAFRTRPRTVLLAAVVAVGLSLVWLVPVLWLTGGVARYEQITTVFMRQQDFWVPTLALLRGDPRNFLNGAFKLLSYVAFASSIATLALLLYVLAYHRTLPAKLTNARTVFFAAWVAPPLIFYLFVLTGQQGVIFIFFPLVALLAAAAASGLLADRRIGPLNLLWTSTVVVALLQAAIFVALPEHLPRPLPPKIVNRSAIADLDQHYLSLFAVIRSEFPPDRTVLVGANWRQVGYYLPEYRLMRLPAVNAGGQLVTAGPGDGVQRISAQSLGLPRGAANGLTVVLFDGDRRQVPAGVSMQTVPLAVGSPVYVFSVPDGTELRWTNGRLGEYPAE